MRSRRSTRSHSAVAFQTLRVVRAERPPELHRLAPGPPLIRPRLARQTASSRRIIVADKRARFEAVFISVEQDLVVQAARNLADPAAKSSGYSSSTDQPCWAAF
jgi:hypothetical protein